MLASSLTLAVAGGQVSPVPLCLTTAGSVGGFTDPNKDRQDSMKDFKDSPRHRKQFYQQQREAVLISLAQRARDEADQANARRATAATSPVCKKVAEKVKGFASKLLPRKTG